MTAGKTRWGSTVRETLITVRGRRGAGGNAGCDIVLKRVRADGAWAFTVLGPRSLSARSLHVYVSREHAEADAAALADAILALVGGPQTDDTDAALEHERARPEDHERGEP